MSEWRIKNLFRRKALTISAPVRVLFWGFLASALCVGMLGVVFLQKQASHAAELSRLTEEQIKIERTIGLLNLVAVDLYSLYVPGAASASQHNVDSLLSHGQELNISAQKLGASGEDADLFSKFMERLGSFTRSHVLIASRARAGGVAFSRDRSELENGLLERLRLHSDLVDMGLRSSRRALMVDAMGAEAAFAAWALAIFSLSAIICALGFTVYVAAKFIRPISQILATAASIDDSRIIAHFPHLDRKDEIGAVARLALRLQNSMRESHDLKRRTLKEQRAHENAEEKFSRLQVRSRKVTDNLPQGILVVESGSSVALINKSYMEIYRFPDNAPESYLTLDDVLQHHAERGLVPAYAGLHEAAAIERLAMGRPSVHQVRLNDGRTIRVRETLLAGGGWISIHEDFTDQGRLHRQLERTERFLVTVMENVGEAIFARDPNDHKYTFVNRAAEVLLGLNRSAIIGKTAREVLGEAVAQRIENGDSILMDPASSEIEDSYTIETPGNGHRDIAVRRLRIVASKGHAAYLLSVIRDITPPAGAGVDPGQFHAVPARAQRL